MFSKETYIRRRAELKRMLGSGLVLLPGNNEAPSNYPANGYISSVNTAMDSWE